MLETDKFCLKPDNVIVKPAYENLEGQGVENYLIFSCKHVDTSKDGHIDISYDEEKYIRFIIMAKGEYPDESTD